MEVSTNFTFLRAEFSSFGKSAQLAEKAIYPDPHAACFHCRRTLELVVHWLYRAEPSLDLPYENSLGALLHEPSFKSCLPEFIFQKAKLIQRNGNEAVHGKRPVSQLTALQTLQELYHLLHWVARTYTQEGTEKLKGLTFDQKLVPFPHKKSSAADKAALKTEEEKAKKATKELFEKTRQADELADEVKVLQEELAKAKAKNEQVPDTHDYSEDDTRKYIIDAELRRAGWDPEGTNVAEYEVQGMPNKKGVGYVDYVLWGDNGKPLAVVEAKKATVDSKVGQQQAKLYADCLEQMTGQRPLIFYTNGYVTWFWDDQMYPHRKVSGFFKKSELERIVTRRTTQEDLSIQKLNQEIAGRYYQNRVIASICDVFNKKQRKSLLVMATGTGKTRTSIALVDLLQKNNWVKNALFLADRVSLVNQATGAFKEHLPDSSPVNLVTDKNEDGRLYTCTYPTMMGLIDSMEKGEAKFSAGHFDLIIIDEAHRSIYQKYKSIFEYFDSLLVGLTATPREEVDKNTYDLFDLEAGVPTDAYELETAVSDGFLVPPTAKIVDMKFPRDGITYDDLDEDEKKEWESLDWGDRAQEEGSPKKVNSGAVNKWLFNKDTADKVLEELMTNGHKVDGGDRLAKTIIFARNHRHAEFIEDRFNHHYPEKKGSFARVIDNYQKYPQSLINDFSGSEKEPHIAISVDMMDTGIDVPEVCNLVFFKPIYSKIKFWQMIGRGTRLCPNLFGLGRDKENFRVFDFCGNFDFFKEQPDGIVAGGGESLKSRIFRTRVAILSALQADVGDNAEGTFRSLRETLKSEVQSMHMDNFQVRMQRKVVAPMQGENFWKSNLIADAHIVQLGQVVADLPTTLPSDDIESRQFDASLLNLQLAHVTADDGKFNTYQNAVVEAASKLEEVANIPAVKMHLAFIQAVQQTEFWEDVSLDQIEEIRVKLRGIMHLVEKGYSPTVYTNFTDEIVGVKEEVVIETPTMTSAQYEKKVKAELAKNLDRIEIQKLRAGKPLTAQDLEQLEALLTDLGGLMERKCWSIY